LSEHCDKLNAKLEIEFLPAFLDPSTLDRSPYFHYKSEVTGMMQALSNYFNSIVESLEELID
jgi:hypothetical protein